MKAAVHEAPRQVVLDEAMEFGTDDGRDDLPAFGERIVREFARAPRSAAAGGRS